LRFLSSDADRRFWPRLGRQATFPAELLDAEFVEFLLSDREPLGRVGQAFECDGVSTI
jgi:hypothetical protein